MISTAIEVSAGDSRSVDAEGSNTANCASTNVATTTSAPTTSGLHPRPIRSPNRTFVKYQRLEVSHTSASVDASVIPAAGSAQPGSDRSRTISTFAAKTP